MPRPSSITSFRASLWPELSRLAADLVVPFEMLITPRELHDVLHADEFLHRPGACAERTVHLRHILLGDAGD